MFTVALALDDGRAVALAASPDDVTDIVAEIADTSAQFLARRDWAEALQAEIVAAAVDVGLDIEAVDLTTVGLLSGTFDEVRVVNGDDVHVYGLHSCGRWARELEAGFAGQIAHATQFKGRGDVSRDGNGRWCKGAQCQTGGGLGALGDVGPVNPAQAGAARDDIAADLEAAGSDLDARAGVLSRLDSHGPASTMAQHDRLPGDQWTEERQQLHNEIIDSVFAANAHIPAEHKAIVVGGLPGAGKSTVLARDDLELNPSEYMHLDPDGIKQMLLDRNAIPRVKGMTDGEHAALLHEESSHIAGIIQSTAQHRGLNIIVDKTMGKPPRREIAGLRQNGYAIRGVFVDIPVDESHYSAQQRWRRGGRFIPPSYIESSRAQGGSVNKHSFQDVAHEFDDWMIINNAGLGTPAASPAGTVVRGQGVAQFASNRMTVFRSVPRDPDGQWCKGAQCSPGAPAEHADRIIAGGRVTVSPEMAVPTIEDLGQRPDPSDLTLLTIDGHPNLFADVADNQLRRVDMPQIPTAQLDGFADYLHERGITTSISRVDPASLRATQNELDGRKVGQMMTAIRTGTMAPADHPLWVSSDSRLLDGHHRWAAEATLSVGESPRSTTIVRASVPMTQLIGHARIFANSSGIVSKRHGMSLSERVARFASVPRDPHGQWCKGAQCSEGPHITPGQKAAHTKRLQAAAKPAADASLNGLPGPDELSKMEKVGGPLGSNGGQWYRDEHGQKYLVKPARPKAHAHNELAAGMTYEHLGVPVNGTGTFERDGKSFVVKRSVDGHTIGTSPTPDLQMQARHGFHADTLTSSWDTFGLVGDNTLVGNDGHVYRIDVGGSNMFRAMGGDKESFNPGHKWVEPHTMRTSTQGRKLYGNMSDQEAAGQLSKLHAMNLDALDAKFAAAGIDPAVRQRTIATYRDRVNVQLPGIIAQLGGH